MTALITGATGLLGGHLTRLMLEAGHPVRALLRPGRDPGPLAALGAEVVFGDLHPAHGLSEAVEGVSAVIHCAGGGYALTPEDFDANNVHTTAALLDAMRAARTPPRRLVLVSSLAALGPSPDGLPLAPDAAPRPVTLYGQSKARAEALALACQPWCEVVILRPPGIYGPGDTRMLPMFRAARRGWLPIPATARTASLVHVEDCARALSMMALDPRAPGLVCTLDDGHPLTFEAMAGHLGAATGRQTRLLRVPAALLKAAGGLSELTARVRRRPALLTRDKVQQLIQPHWVCDSTALTSRLGWRPTLSFAQGAAQTARWYRDHGWLRP